MSIIDNPKFLKPEEVKEIASEYQKFKNAEKDLIKDDIKNEMREYLKKNLKINVSICSSGLILKLILEDNVISEFEMIDYKQCLKSLLEGLEAENIDEFIEIADPEKCKFFGKAIAYKIREIQSALDFMYGG